MFQSCNKWHEHRSNIWQEWEDAYLKVLVLNTNLSFKQITKKLDDVNRRLNRVERSYKAVINRVSDIGLGGNRAPYATKSNHARWEKAKQAGCTKI